MIDLRLVSDSGRVVVGRVAAVNEEGVDSLVSILVDPNTEDGRVVMTADKALEVAAQLIVHASGGVRE